jgi:large subunit ribosomal protein L32
MALPTQKRTKSSKRKRAFHHRLKATNFSLCPKCKKPVLPHHVCSFCGTYAGREVIEIKLKEKDKKKEEKEKKK